MKQMCNCSGSASVESSVFLAGRCRILGISVDFMIKEIFLNTVRGVCPYAVGQNVIDNLEEHSAILASAERDIFFFLVNQKNLLKTTRLI